MKVFQKIVDLQNELFEVRKQGKKVGLVPTMGALHEGHASLVRLSVKDNDVTVVPDTRRFEYPPVSTVMEGAHRPGHFNGVCQVVSRLFYIVKPDRAYLGEKDWQQIAVVKAMVRQLGLPVEIVECPIVRDADGLARSSRNTLLAPDERAIAPRIYKALNESLTFAKTHTLGETHDYVVNEINSVEGLDVEYFAIVDGNTLQDVAQWEDSPYIVGCITVYCGKTPIRLIDHIKYKEA